MAVFNFGCSIVPSVFIPHFEKRHRETAVNLGYWWDWTVRGQQKVVQGSISHGQPAPKSWSFDLVWSHDFLRTSSLLELSYPERPLPGCDLYQTWPYSNLTSAKLTRLGCAWTSHWVYISSLMGSALGFPWKVLPLMYSINIPRPLLHNRCN